MSPQPYEGWSNYPTWAVNLWLANDEGLYRHTLSLVRAWADERDVAPDVVDLAQTEVVRPLAESIESFVESFPDVERIQSKASPVADVFGWAFGHVDWYEIARAWARDELDERAAA